MKSESIAQQLAREADYAQRSLCRDLLFEIYGKAMMAYQLNKITSEEYMQINHMTVYFINTHARELEDGIKRSQAAATVRDQENK